MIIESDNLISAYAPKSPVVLRWHLLNARTHEWWKILQDEWMKFWECSMEPKANTILQQAVIGH